MSKLSKAFGKTGAGAFIGGALGSIGIGAALGYLGKGKKGDPKPGESQEDYFNRVVLNQMSGDDLAQRYKTYDTSVKKGAKTSDMDKRYLAAYKGLTKELGRDPSANELAELLPSYQKDSTTGNAALSQYVKSYKQSPEYLKSQAPQYSGQVNQTFQNLMKRGATQEEADYFGRLLASGQVSEYEINSFVQQLPEYQTAQDKSFRGSLEGELAGYDEKAFGRERENILSQYTKAGLQNSTALDFAITDALGKVQEQRGQYLAGLSSQQYGGNKEAARGDYEYQRNMYQQNQNYNRSQSDQYMDYLTQRGDQAVDYNTQRNDYLNFLAMQPKQKGSGMLGGALQGAGAGAAFGPWGALIGGGAGAGLSYLNG